MEPKLSLVDTGWLRDHLTDDELLVCDCRFAGTHEASRAGYLEGHIPGAIHVFWLEDLSAADTSVTTFLPSAEEAARFLGRLGIDGRTFVVGYADNANLYASRLWHVLNAFGHRAVALLDGGIDKWVAEGRPQERQEVVPSAASFRPSTDGINTELIGRDEIRARLDDPGLRIVDVRAPAEFDGHELRAARGGHIPGAVLLPWDDNLRADDLALAHGDPRACAGRRCAPRARGRCLLPGRSARRPHGTSAAACRLYAGSGLRRVLGGVGQRPHPPDRDSPPRRLISGGGN